MSAPARALRTARQLTRAALERTAHDLTDVVAARTALVLAPHPDDETIGCGATILRKVAAGTSVTVFVATDGRHSHRSAALPPDQLARLRREEMAEAVRRLGLPPSALVWGGLTDGSLEEETATALVATLVRDLRPEELYVTSADEPHPDHAALGRAARRAVAGTATQLLEYPVWLWDGWPARTGERVGSVVDAVRRIAGRRAAVVRSADFIDGKRHALAAHSCQLRRPDVVPVGEEWQVLPESLLAAAFGPSELFLT